MYAVHQCNAVLLLLLLLLPLLLLLLLHQVENALQVEGQRIPNLTHPDVPAGGEENATVMSLVRRHCCCYCLCYRAGICSCCRYHLL
jgi:hypothetical protein